MAKKYSNAKDEGTPGTKYKLQEKRNEGFPPKTAWAKPASSSKGITKKGVFKK